MGRHLLARDEHHGLLVEAGFIAIPAAGGGTRSLNRYRFAVPYIWHVQNKYLSEEVQTMQRRLADALEVVYDSSKETISALLITLFEATGQQERAEAYRPISQRFASLDALRWQVTALEQIVKQNQVAGEGPIVAEDRHDSYRLFELRCALSDRLCGDSHWEEGYTHAQNALLMARSWSDRVREASALNLVGLNLHVGAQFAEVQEAFEQSLTIGEWVWGPAHSDVATILNNLGMVYQAQGRHEEARPLFQQALLICQERLGSEHPNTQIVRQNLATLEAAQETERDDGSTSGSAAGS